MPATTIYLLRHGTTAANLTNRFAGRSAEPLHPKGREQVAILADTLTRHGITSIVAGPLPRVQQTAEIIAHRLAVPVYTDPRLTEINLPHWDGLTKDAIRRRHGRQYPEWLSRPEKFQVPGCETIADVQRRAVTALEQIFTTHAGSTTLVISHLIVIRGLLLAYLQQPIRRFRSLKIDNGCLCRLVRGGNGEGETTVSLPR